MSEERYLREAYDYYQQLWREAMRRAAARRLVIKASTLAALGGASALNSLLAACAAGADRQELAQGELEAGAYQYSRFPAIEKYNWRKLPWPTTPYLDGAYQVAGGGPSRWDFVGLSLTSYSYTMDNLMNKKYGAGADMQKDELKGHIAETLGVPARDFSYYDYKIRPDVYFHDIPPVNGRRLTAEDVKYCLDIYRTQGLARSALEIVDRIELVDKETVRVHLKRPVLWLNHLLSSNDFYMFAREHFEGDRDWWNNQPIGTGPFKVLSTRFRGDVETVRHEKFMWRDERWPDYQLPFLRSYREIYFADSAAALAAFRTRQTDFTTVSDRVQLEDILATNPDVVVQVYAPNTTYPPYPWVLNVQDPLLQDVRVRRALSLALDRSAMLEVLVGGWGSASHPVAYPWLGRDDPLDWSELGPWQQYNPTLAKQLLTEAGYPNGFELEYVTTAPVGDDDLLTAKYLEAIGVRVKFIEQESTVVTATRQEKRFRHGIKHTPQTGYDAIKLVREWYLPQSPRNWGRIDDPVMTELVERATYTLDPDEQSRLLWEINQRELDQVYSLQRFVYFTIHIRQPYLFNVASAVQGYFNAWGKHQIRHAWIDDTAPAGRAGRLRA